MKKIILMTTLILALIAQPAYAQTSDAQPGDGISGSMSPFVGESFQTDLATGAATMSVPITVPPGRKNMQPKLALSYSSNNSNGICGVGWAIPTNVIQRSTKRGVPKYNNTDTFIFASSGANAELVDIGGNEYRAKIESAFMKYIFNGTSWLVYDKSGTKYYFGQASASRLEKDGNVYGWYLDRVEDVYGNFLTYIYEKHTDGQIYLTEIQYTGYDGVTPLTPDKKIIFSYLEDRSDKLYSYRSGWKITTSRRLSSIEVQLNDQRVWLYMLDYITSSDTDRSLLYSITVEDALEKTLPPKTFTYQRLE